VIKRHKTPYVAGLAQPLFIFLLKRWEPMGFGWFLKVLKSTAST